MSDQENEPMSIEEGEGPLLARDVVFLDKKLIAKILRQGPRSVKKAKCIDNSYEPPFTSVSMEFLKEMSKVSRRFHRASLKVISESCFFFANSEFLMDRTAPLDPSIDLDKDPALNPYYKSVVHLCYTDGVMSPYISALLSKSEVIKTVRLRMSWLNPEHLVFSNSITELCLSTLGDLNFDKLKLPMALTKLSVTRCCWGRQVTTYGKLNAPSTLVDLILLITPNNTLDSYVLKIPDSVRDLTVNFSFVKHVRVHDSIKRLRLGLCAYDSDFRTDLNAQVLPRFPKHLEYAAMVKFHGVKAWDCYNIALPVLTDDEARSRIQGIREMQALGFVDPNETGNVRFLPPNMTRISLSYPWYLAKSFLCTNAFIKCLNLSLCEGTSHVTGTLQSHEIIDLRDFPHLKSLRLAGDVGTCKIRLNENIEILNLGNLVGRSTIELAPRKLPPSLKEFSAHQSFVPRKDRFSDEHGYNLEYFSMAMTKGHTVNFRDLPPKMRRLALWASKEGLGGLDPVLEGAAPASLDYVTQVGTGFKIDHKWTPSPLNPYLAVEIRAQ